MNAAPFVAHSSRGEVGTAADTLTGALRHQRTLRGVIKRAGEVVVKAIADHVAAEIGEDHPNALSRLDILDGVGNRGRDA
ncbi:hypothetical protein DC31_13715 [Microbacterium sp. CH12i]|uniref:hypothetical protein n=1 Tax=Microbacterium sp. CH12i TaxID=1479651 RepID=UPI000461AD65|nr:hypothetical protein [Microbacterium sp. CH12i]KDA05844.1 hypothetical protein DC31_13715 [Microbacterium sp. CH12i]